QMINVGTAQIVNTGREQFKSIEEAYDIIPKLVKAFVGTFGGGTYKEPVTAADAGKKLTRRQKIGMAAFFSGIAVGGGSVFLWIEADNQAYQAHEAYTFYSASNYFNYESLKQAYIDELAEKNLWLFSALGASVLGGAAIITGSLFWFGPDNSEQPAASPAPVAFRVLPIPGGAYLSVEY
ncbi:MAG: hypothetical protein JW760_13390, partial [Spirochaetales bacterium]|nr:hypothetical protein [Spirochaetales bacterium]